jgi:hypothetical protein
MHDVAAADKEQQGAFVRDERVLVVWTDDLDHIVPLCKDFEQKLIKLVWRSRPASRHVTSTTASLASPFSQPTSKAGSQVGLNDTIEEQDEKEAALEELAKEAPRAQAPPKKSFFSFGRKPKSSAPSTASDPEKASEPEPRPMRLFAPVYNGLAAALSICTC